MKTGRLLKFQRPGGVVHAYLYRDGSLMRAALYLMTSGERPAGDPVYAVSGPSEAGVEADVRAWVDSHFPRSG